MVRGRRTSLRERGGRLDQAGDPGNCGRRPGQCVCVSVCLSVCAPSTHRQGQAVGVDGRPGRRWCSPGSLLTRAREEARVQRRARDRDKGGHGLTGQLVCRPADTWLHPAPHLSPLKANQQAPEVPPESWVLSQACGPN